MKWFKSCQTLEDVKKTYRALCFKYHPDINKSADAESIMKEINAEYEKAFERLKNVHRSTVDGETYEAETVEVPEEFRNIINGLIGCNGVQIDIVGRWVWLTGNTFIYKDQIKGLGFRWANKKKAWYWHPADCKATHSKMTLDEIKEKYGCQTIGTAYIPQIA